VWAKWDLGKWENLRVKASLARLTSRRSKSFTQSDAEGAEIRGEERNGKGGERAIDPRPIQISVFSA
jgi:hypothetical protein